MNADNYSQNKRRFKKRVNQIDYQEEEEDQEDDSGNDVEWINNLTAGKKNDKQVKCKFVVNEKDIAFQLDTGSSVNILPSKYVDIGQVKPTNTILKTWKGDNYLPIGELRHVNT